MEIRLASNEVIYKRFDYTTRKAKNSKRSLIITNKRVISEIMDRTGVKRKEIPVDEAEFVSTSYANTKSSLIGVILLTILAVGFAVVGLKVNMPIPYGQYIAFGLGGLFLLLALILLIKFFKNRQATVEITISGIKRETNIISLGSSNMSSKGKMKDIKIQVDRNQSIKMVNELGATLLDVKSLNMDELLERQKEDKKEDKKKNKKEVIVEAKEEIPEENKVEEEAPVEEEQAVEEEAPAEEQVAEEEAPAEEQVAEEEVPVEEEQVAEEEVPVEEEQVAEEEVPVEEQVVEEEAPAEEEKDPLDELEEKLDNAIEVTPEVEDEAEGENEAAIEEPKGKRKGKKRK